MKRSLAVSLLSMMFACGDNYEVAPDAPPGPQCSDHIDNDGDGKIDFPKDLGCESSTDESEDSPAQPTCSDHRDNDHDGKIDYPDDPGCAIPQADSEVDDCPNGPGCPQCSNGKDDDGDGAQDFPGLGCDSAADPIEFVENPTACGATLKIKPLPATNMDDGMLDATSTSSIISPCGGVIGAPAIAYLMVLTRPKVVVISTVGSPIDTIVELRGSMCMPDSAHIACNDNVGGTDKTSKVTRSLGIGAYYIIVKGKTAATIGMYHLEVQQFAGEGEQCTDTAQCGPGLVCRTPVGGTNMICTQPVCNDGLDDDGDGTADYPGDPGCVSPDDGDEVDDCPNGASCPDCSDGVDNDGDSHIDYPADPSCAAASSTSEACNGEQDPIIDVVTGVTMSTLIGAHNDHTPIAGCSGGPGGGVDVLFTLSLPAMSTLRLSTENSAFTDTVLSLLNGSCSEPSLACDDDGGASPAFSSLINTGNLAAGTYIVAVDSYDAGATPLNTFQLAVSGTIAPGGACEGALAMAGAITCPVGLTCDGTPGAKTCRNACTDGIDNNGDGKIDYPNDPGCSSPSDSTENTVCPGPMCPACGDGIDNDGDTFIDYPMDTSCQAAGGTNESCVTSEPIGLITATTTTGTTTGAVNNSTPVCGSTIHTAPDLIYQINLPAMSSLNLNLTGFDGAHYLLNSSCTGAPVACSDPSLMAVTNLAAGTYFVVVDGWGSGQGPFTLTTSGTIAPGGACEGQLATAGVITCGAGFMCDGPVGAKTCRNQCNDGIDNNGDGKTDYPNDPGCSAPNDTTENTVCPGATCPACADGIDNDGDTFIDYPLDINCQAAGGTSESCVSSEPIGLITSATTTGTTTGAVNNSTPVCGSTIHTAPDLIYQIDVPTMASLNLNLTGFDGAHYLLNATCTGTQLACSDPSLMALTNLAAGTYFVVVDGWGSGQGPFTLTTSGTIAQGGACEGLLATAGVISCAAGFVCDGTPGAKTCRNSQCTDGLDNNGDGKTDYPNDPGCSSPGDNTETTVCPGMACPVCADGIDNDGDTFIDYPMDPQCSAASGASELCNDQDPIGAVVSGVTNGTLVGAHDDHNPSCTTPNAPDVLLALDLPTMATLRLSTEGSVVLDTVLSLLPSTCAEPSLACDDDSGNIPANSSLINMTNVPAGSYFVAVDAYDTFVVLTTFVLNVSGTIAAGGSCAGALATSGAITCQVGTSCTAGTCQ